MKLPERTTEKEAPTGIVTLLFTDITGSSRLWEQHGDRFIPVWQAHDALMRDAISRFGGYEVKSEGDAFMVAFAKAEDALHCALFAQAALARYPWPPDIGAIQVRMGLHTGEPFVHGNDYFGPMVNRSARICSAAHGGQVLLSEETLNCIGPGADSRVDFSDLGEYRLKDMGTPQRLYQATHPSMEVRAFPPPRSLEGQPNNLPVQRTSFVGRAKEIEQIAGFLAQGEKPVLTLTGPKGIGKTRLSLQVAAAHAEWFPDGVWYVPLVGAKDIVGAAVQIATAINIPLRPGVPPMEEVRDWLADRRCLLVLDDANAFPQADSLLRELLSGSNTLRCLATSRESLQIEEAADLNLSGLSLEADVVASEEETAVVAGRSEAEQLFLERVAEVNPEMSLSPREQNAMQELLQQLEGVPASVERAAAMMDKVPPDVVLEWLNQHLQPDRVPPRPAGAEKFKNILRRNAQKVLYSLEDKTKTAVTTLGQQLLQGIANVAADRNDATATELGRQTLRLSQQFGDDLGTAAALRQLSRVKWQQGDRQSAAALLAAAVQIYRRYNAPEVAEAHRELEVYREVLEQVEGAIPLTPSLERAVALAMGENSLPA